MKEDSFLIILSRASMRKKASRKRKSI